jgi:hypothetical protein
MQHTAFKVALLVGYRDDTTTQRHNDTTHKRNPATLANNIKTTAERDLSEDPIEVE